MLGCSPLAQPKGPPRRSPRCIASATPALPVARWSTGRGTLVALQKGRPERALWVHSVGEQRYRELAPARSPPCIATPQAASLHLLCCSRCVRAVKLFALHARGAWKAFWLEPPRGPTAHVHAAHPADLQTLRPSGMCQNCPTVCSAAVAATQAAHRLQDDRKRERAAQRREGAHATARHKRRLNHTEQYEVNTSDHVFRRVMCFGCGCQLENCAVVTAVLFNTCAQMRHIMNTCGTAGDMAGQQLMALLEPARCFQPNTGRYTFNFNAAIPIGATGHVVCPRKARELFHIADNMWRALKKALKLPVLPESIWNTQLKPPRNAHLGMTCRTWIRAYAQLVGDVMPTNGTIQLEAMTLRCMHLAFAGEMEEFISYSYFCECWNEERKVKPTLVRAAVPLLTD